MAAAKATQTAPPRRRSNNAAKIAKLEEDYKARLSRAKSRAEKDIEDVKNGAIIGGALITMLPKLRPELAASLDEPLTETMDLTKRAGAAAATFYAKDKVSTKMAQGAAAAACGVFLGELGNRQ